MEPVTVIASIIAIGQALDRIAVLATKSKQFLEAPSEFQSLVNETLDLRLVLDRLQIVVTTTRWSADDREVVLHDHLLKSCKTLLEAIKSIIENELTREKTPSAVAAVRRWGWVKRRNEVLTLRNQLRETKALLCLTLVGSTL